MNEVKECQVMRSGVLDHQKQAVCDPMVPVRDLLRRKPRRMSARFGGSTRYVTARHSGARSVALRAVFYSAPGGNVKGGTSGDIYC
jgi:hypothetical protein